MIPRALVEAQRQAQRDVVTLALRDLLTLWRRLDLTDARAATDVLLPVTRDITAAYGEVAAVSAADFYDEARAASGASGRFTARPAPPAPVGQVDAMVRSAVTPLWARVPRVLAARDQVGAGLSRLVQQPARDTVWSETRRDGARYTVVPAGDACHWCLMLASRGGVFHARQTARVSVEAGREYHDNCRCVVQPVWSADDLPEANRRLGEEWQRVQREAGEAGELTGPDASASARNAWRRAVERGDVRV